MKMKQYNNNKQIFFCLIDAYDTFLIDITCNNLLQLMESYSPLTVPCNNYV